MTHYYDSGCALFDLSTNPPTQYSLDETIIDCQAVNSAVPARCEAEFYDLLVCFNSTPSPVTSDADCDCSQERDALVRCG